MASFRVYRMRPHVKQYFRWAPHVSGLATVKARDYQPGGEFEAANEYALWAALRNSDQALEVGDLVELGGGGGVLKICKFVGFESAKWLETETAHPSSVSESVAPEPGVTQGSVTQGS
jgi:hypothetical protein